MEKIGGGGGEYSSFPCVLFIEDDKFLRKLLGKKLAQAGFMVKEVERAEEAFEILKEENVSLILLDLILPGIDGYEFMERLKKEERWKDIPVVVFSNLAREEEEKKVRELGAVEYLLKAEHTPGVIVEKLKMILASRSSSRSS
jgi:CheY-like chemotaxis protein